MKTKFMTILAGFALVLMASCGGSTDKGGENGEGGSSDKGDKKEPAKYGLDIIKQEGTLKEAYPCIETIVTAMNTGNYDKAFNYMTSEVKFNMDAIIAVANKYVGGFTLPASKMKECQVVDQGGSEKIKCILEMEDGSKDCYQFYTKYQEGGWKVEQMLPLMNRTFKGEKGAFQITGLAINYMGKYEGEFTITMNEEETIVLFSRDDNGAILLTEAEGEEVSE